MTKQLLPLLILAAQPAFSADDNLAECRRIEDVQERVACYDAIVDARNAVQDETAPDARSLFGTADAEARQIVEQQLAIEQIDKIEASVAEVRRSAGNKLTVTLDNGQIWRQLDSRRLLLDSGDAIVVRKASLGSYLLEKASGSRSIRVKRIN